MKHSVIILSVGMLFGLVCAQAAEKTSVSFEDPFPATWYKKALDTCMQVWADLDALIESKETMELEDRLLVLDASTGRLVYVATCFEQMIRTNQSVANSDVMYLTKILALLESHSKKLQQASADERIACFQRVLSAVQQKLKSVLAVLH